TMGALAADPKLAMIQTPHHFYSPDPFERNLGIFRKVPNESALFYGIIQDGNDLWDATFFCGSCAVLRRTALEEIGGIAVETVTEDAHTALRMHSKGWSTAYLNLPQAAGLATSRLADHVGQRIRWARGMVQILRVDNPLFKQGLKFPQRLCYLNSMLHYLFAGPRFIFLLSPLVYLILGRSNVFGYLPGILAYGLPHVFLSTLMNSRVQGNYRHSFWNEVYEMVLAPYIFLPTLLALINPKWGKFNVTAKESVVEGTHFDWGIAKPFVVLLLLNLVGMGMGGYRVWTEGDPQGVLAVNLVWAFFNTLMLGGALAVANESKQIRTTVRVNSTLPVRITLPDGQIVTGQTDDLSLGGVVARLVRSNVLERGDFTRIVVSLGSEDYTLPVKVTSTSGSLVRFRFGDLNLSQQAMLTRVIFGRADSWLKWRFSYEVDRPLVNLLRITAMSIRGIGVALYSLVPKRKPTTKEARNVREQTVLPLAFLLLLLAGAPSATAQSSLAAIPAESAPIGAAIDTGTAPWFRDVRDLSSLGLKQGSMVRGARGRFTLHFGLPITKMVVESGLALHYRVSPRVAKGSRIHVSLNGSPAGTIPVQTGRGASTVVQADLALSPDLFVADNTLDFDFDGQCAGNCSDSAAADLWLSFESSTEIRTAGTLLPMPNRLKLLPAPFLAAGAQKLVDIPFVLDQRSDAATKQAAGVVASWFGVKADNQALRFPVTEGVFPSGNVVLLATKDSPLATAIGVDTTVPSVSIRNNPSDAYGKILAIVAENGRGLIDAARAFALERYSKEGDFSLLSLSDLPAVRKPYDAPRWLDTTREVRLAEDMSDSQLEVRGSGSIPLYFRLPPDLYYGNRDTVPFYLRYRSSALARGSKAFAKLHLNGQLIASRPIPTNSRTEIHEEVIYLPVAAIYPRNTLTVEFSYEAVHLQDEASNIPEAAILRSSELMVKGLPHFAAMPRLDMLANTGFPYTRVADLSETLVLLPAEPTSDELSLYLTMASFMGAQTGYPALRIEVVQPNGTPGASDKDILMIGALDRQPLLQKWAAHMLVQPSGKRFHLVQSYDWRQLLANLPGSGGLTDRKNLELILANDSQVEGVVQGFASPFFPGRTVVAFTSMPGKGLASLAEDWASVADASRLYGSVSLFSGNQFHSFTLESSGYHVGNLANWPAMQYWGRRYYWLSPVLIFACMWLLTLFFDKRLEARAAERLEARS
ncbi:MAG TPA: cellulose biosynthesis cyclic di-GMP-binding regulatory protein BcsB, partial [Bryobacteraceae bacterium]|nr:cellulose biosynthesis cyclic di-GMP-binding regulatory protein BcsB [Bryobacteraceae bacterium]